LPKSPVIAVRLSDGMRPVRLKLDSGTNAPLLYNTAQYMALGLFRGASWHGDGANGKQQAFMALPPQNMKIGSLELPRVLFVTFAGGQKNLPPSDFDGLMATGLFRRVFIAHQGLFAVLESW